MARKSMKKSGRVPDAASSMTTHRSGSGKAGRKGKGRMKKSR